MTVGANILTQLFSASVTFALGLCGGLFALLFKRKSNRIEQVLTDFFVIVCLTLLFLLSVEYGAFGQVHAYLIAVFGLGVYVGYLSLNALLKVISRKFPHFLKRRVLKAIPSSSQDNPKTVEKYNVVSPRGRER